jgi:hypothetical protein
MISPTVRGGRSWRRSRPTISAPSSHCEREGFQHGVQPSVFLEVWPAVGSARAGEVAARPADDIREASYRRRSGLKLQFGESGVKAAAGDQLLVAALLDNAAGLHHQDAIT